MVPPKVIPDFEVPISEPLFHVRLVCLFEGTDVDLNKCGDLQYLQLCRRKDPPSFLEELKRGYERSIRSFVADLCSTLPHDHFDGMLAAPSSRNHPMPYLDGFLARHPGVLDLTGYFKKPPGVSSGSTNMTAQKYAGLLEVNCGDLSGLKSLLIIDDVVSTGTTAAGLIIRLQSAGLATACPITVAVPLKVQRGIKPKYGL